MLDAPLSYPRPRCEVAVLERPRTAERFARGFTAAVVAVATLLLAANVGSARAADSPSPQFEHVSRSSKPAP